MAIYIDGKLVAENKSKVGRPKKIGFDERDITIAKMIGEQQSVVNIAKEIGITDVSVRQRLRKLQRT